MSDFPIFWHYHGECAPIRTLKIKHNYNVKRLSNKSFLLFDSMLLLLESNQTALLSKHKKVQKQDFFFF